MCIQSFKIFTGIGFIFGLSVSLLTINSDKILPNYGREFFFDLKSQWQHNIHQQQVNTSDNNHDLTQSEHIDHHAHNHEELENATGRVNGGIYVGIEWFSKNEQGLVFMPRS